MGLNKATTAAMLIAGGLNIFEPMVGIGLKRYVDQATDDKLGDLQSDIESIVPGAFTSKK
jgi:hypothetical protein